MTYDFRDDKRWHNILCGYHSSAYDEENRVIALILADIADSLKELVNIRKGELHEVSDE